MTREHAAAPKALPIPKTRDREDDLEDVTEHDPADFDRIWARAQIKSKTGRKAPAPSTKSEEEATGHKEISWVRPSTASSGGLEKVGSIFFRTKEHSIDGNDQQLIKQLVNAYASHARAHKGGDGLMGRVVGYADPRSSHQPDNLQLSGLRAANVADELTQALDASNIATGFYTLERKGAGIAPGVPKKGDLNVEGNTLAPFRRADIYIKGQADEHVAPSAQPGPPAKNDVPKPPDYSKQVHDFDRWSEYIADGNTDFIKGIALRVQADLGYGGTGDFKTTLIHLGFKTTPPPWWSGRIPGSDQTGRRRRSPSIDQLGGKEKLIAKAQLLVRDYRELSFYTTEQMNMIGKWRDAAIKNDAALAAKYAAPFEHLLFMIDETEKLAKEVEQLVE